LVKNKNIGKIVREFYNENPFPGFDISKYRIRDDLYKNANIYSCLLDEQIPWNKSILDAGCGTGELACFLASKNRKILGIDFSEQSLSMGRDLADKLKLKTLDFQKEDLLKLVSKNRKFDFIFCNGVLHHINNPYQGFVNIIKSARKGTLIIIGLYNKYGRLRLKFKRIWINRKYRDNRQRIDEAIQEILVKDEHDTKKQYTWYQDQYQHPYESTHTITELLGWFKKNDIEYVNSLPPIELFRKEKNAMRIFRKSPVKGWRSNKFSHFLKQLKWIFSLRKTSGYFLIIGKKS